MDLDYIVRGFTVRVWNPQDWRQHNVSGPWLHFWAVLTSTGMSDVSSCARCLSASHHARAQLHLLSPFPVSVRDAVGCPQSHPFSQMNQLWSHSLCSQGKGSSLAAAVASHEIVPVLLVSPAFTAVFQVCWWAQSRGVILPLALMAVSCSCCQCTAGPHCCLHACLAFAQLCAHQCPRLSPRADP